MVKILVVDDETDLEVLIKQKIRDREYEFIFAVNGLHALEQLEEHTDVEIIR